MITQLLFLDPLYPLMYTVFVSSWITAADVNFSKSTGRSTFGESINLTRDSGTWRYGVISQSNLRIHFWCRQCSHFCSSVLQNWRYFPSGKFDILYAKKSVIRTVCETRNSLRFKPTNCSHEYRYKYIKRVLATLASRIEDNRRYVTKKVNRVEELLQKHKNLFQNKKGCCTLVRANFLSKTSSFICHYWWSGQRIRLTGEIGFIETVNYSTWEASIIVWQKVNRTIWLCAYFSKGLNDAIQNHSYNLFCQKAFY